MATMQFKDRRELRSGYQAQQLRTSCTADHLRLSLMLPACAAVSLSLLAIVSPIALAQSLADPHSPLPDMTPSGQASIGGPDAGGDEQYRLGPDDRVQLDIVGLPEYSGEFQVLADGTIGLPLLGSVLVEGMTLRQASLDLSRRFTYYIKNPLVTLRLSQARPIDVVVIGEVNRPGTYSVSSTDTDVASTGNQPTVTQLIQMAGGITQTADIRNIQVHRSQHGHLGQAQKLSANLWQLLYSGELDQDLVLKDGDTIYIPTATEISLSEIDELASASFAPQTISINVVGEVERPGVVEVPPNTPLTQAILSAGGFNDRAGTASVELVRLNSNGTTTRRDIEVDFSQGLSESNNPPLRRGDTVIVQRTGTAAAADTFGLVSPIITPLLLLLGLF